MQGYNTWALTILRGSRVDIGETAQCHTNNSAAAVDAGRRQHTEHSGKRQSQSHFTSGDALLVLLLLLSSLLSPSTQCVHTPGNTCYTPSHNPPQNTQQLRHPRSPNRMPGACSNSRPAREDTNPAHCQHPNRARHQSDGDIRWHPHVSPQRCRTHSKHACNECTYATAHCCSHQG